MKYSIDFEECNGWILDTVVECLIDLIDAMFIQNFSFRLPVTITEFQRFGTLILLHIESHRTDELKNR